MAQVARHHDDWQGASLNCKRSKAMIAASLALGRQLDRKSLLALAAQSIVDIVNCEVGSVHIFQPDRSSPSFFTVSSDRLAPMLVCSSFLTADHS